jgi:hypothetical protein
MGMELKDRTIPLPNAGLRAAETSAVTALLDAM